MQSQPKERDGDLNNIMMIDLVEANPNKLMMHDHRSNRVNNFTPNLKNHFSHAY